MPNPKRSHSIALPYVTVYPCTWWSNGKKDEEGKDSGISERLKFSLEENILARVFMSPILTDSYVQHPPQKKNNGIKQSVRQGAAIARKSNLWKCRQSRGSFLNMRIQSGPSWTSNHHEQIPHTYNIRQHHIISYNHIPTQNHPQSPSVSRPYAPTRLLPVPS